jgi:hypothetical protein
MIADFIFFLLQKEFAYFFYVSWQVGYIDRDLSWTQLIRNRANVFTSKVAAAHRRYDGNTLSATTN